MDAGEGVCAGRASELVMAAMLSRFLPLDAAEEAVVARFLRPTLRNWNGLTVGALQLAAPIS